MCLRSHWLTGALFATPGCPRTTCPTCRSGRRCRRCCSRPSAWASASPGWFSGTKTSEWCSLPNRPTVWVCVCVCGRCSHGVDSLLSCVLQVGVGAAGRPGNRLLPVYAQNSPPPHFQGASTRFLSGKWVFFVVFFFNSPVSVFAGVHLVAERPLRLRRFLRVHHPLLDKRAWLAGQVCSLVAAFHPLTPVCLLQSGESIMVEVAAGPSDSATHEKVSLGPRVHASAPASTALIDRSYSSFLWCSKCPG